MCCGTLHRPGWLVQCVEECGRGHLQGPPPQARLPGASSATHLELGLEPSAGFQDAPSPRRPRGRGRRLCPLVLMKSNTGKGQKSPRTRSGAIFL